MKRFTLYGFQILCIEENFLTGFVFLKSDTQSYRITFTFDRLCGAEIEGILELSSNACYVGCEAFSGPLTPIIREFIIFYIESRLKGQNAAEQFDFLIE